MRPLDWAVLGSVLIFIVIYGTWKGRGSQDTKAYLLANKEMRWWTIAFSIMATQASAITFLSTPGQAFVDGMRFVQFYFGLPIAMVILSITAVPLYHRLKVYTAYEFLETQFDLKTRTLAAFLFLIQRSLAAGLTIYAPSIILSVILGWNVQLTCLVIGTLVIIYTASGGTKAVSWTHSYQVFIIFIGMAAAFGMILYLFPPGISFLDAVRVAGKMGKLNAIDLSFDLNNRYNLWSGVLGGLFLQLSYFGTDQSQVQRYLTGRSITQSRLGLLFNGLVKVPMQFSILFLGAMLFVFYQFVAPPVFFNSVETEKIRSGPYAASYQAVEDQYRDAFKNKEAHLREYIKSIHSGGGADPLNAERNVIEANAKAISIREQAIQLLQKNDPTVDPKDTNYIFLTFVMHFLPVGLVGLVIAAIFSASMSSTAAELNSLASTTVVDIYRRIFKKEESEKQYVRAGKLATVFWGVFAITFAEYANRLGSLVEAVNILGSLFYGTILGIFLLAFYFKWVRGTAAFTAALLAEVGVISCFIFTKISFLWYNVVGCLLVIGIALILNLFMERK